MQRRRQLGAEQRQRDDREPDALAHLLDDLARDRETERELLADQDRDAHAEPGLRHHEVVGGVARDVHPHHAADRHRPPDQQAQPHRLAPDQRHVAERRHDQPPDAGFCRDPRHIAPVDGADVQHGQREHHDREADAQQVGLGDFHGCDERTADHFRS
jgi:hypothetical protein